MNESKRKVKNLREVEEKYRELREKAHRSTVMKFREIGDSKFAHLTITPITPHALGALNSQWTQSERLVSWVWEEQANLWRKKRPSHWEMAIWHKQTLCGLVLGGPSRRRSRLYVEGIEGHPVGNPLKAQIIPIALSASERYAESVGCKEVWLVEPAESLLDLYQRAGYNLKLPNKFLAKVLRLNRYAVKAVGSKL